MSYADKGYTDEDVEYAAAVCDIVLQVIAEGQTGLVLLPCRWVVERSLG